MRRLKKNDMRDPDNEGRFLQMIDKEVAALDRGVEVVCAWKHCVSLYDPVTKRILTGWGSAVCGCDNLPGWDARHPEGKPKPSVPIKARGRHGSRVQRSQRRKAEWLDWLKEYERDYPQPDSD